MKNLLLILLLFINLLPLCAQEKEAEDPVSSETIVIAAEKDPVTPVTLGPAVTVITREEIEASGAVDTGQILDHLAGIKIERVGGALSPLALSIRGSGSERILILVDGRPLPGGDLSLIDPGRIEQIEILKGSASTDGGSGAVGGIIKITTRKEIPEKGLRADLRSSLGSYGLREIGAAVSGETGISRPVAWRLGLSAMAEDALYGYNDDGDIVIRQNAGGERYQFFAGLDWLIDPDREIGLDIAGEGSWTDRGAPGTMDFPSIEARLTDLNLSGSLTGYWNTCPLFGIEGNFSGGLHTVTYKDTGYLLGEIDEFNQEIPLTARLTFFRRETWKYLTLDSRLTGTWNHESLTATALTDNNGNEGSGTPERTAWSVTLSEEAVIGTFTLTPSIRYDHAEITSGDFSRVDNRFSFSAGLLWQPASTVSLKGRLASGYRLPSFSDLFWPATAFAVGNPSLKPEESLSYEVALSAELLPGWFIELVHFNTLLTNMIQWNPGPGGTWRPENIGKASLSGFEGETRAAITLSKIETILTLRGGYGLLFARDLTEDSSTYDKTLPRRPVEQASAGITLTHSKGHSLSVEGRYTGYRFTNAQNTSMIPSSFVLDLSTGICFAPDWEIRLAVSNALDEPYIDSFEYPVPGRSIRLSLLFSPGGRK